MSDLPERQFQAVGMFGWFLLCFASRRVSAVISALSHFSKLQPFIHSFISAFLLPAELAPRPRPITYRQTPSISWSRSIRDARLAREEHRRPLVHASLSCSEMADIVFFFSLLCNFGGRFSASPAERAWQKNGKRGIFGSKERESGAVKI